MENASIFHLLGNLVSYRAQRYCPVSPLMQSRDLPQLHVVHRLLLCVSISPRSLPSLISSRLNLPFGNQERSRRLGSVPYKREAGDTEKILCSGPVGSCLLSVPQIHLHPRHCSWCETFSCSLLKICRCYFCEIKRLIKL